MGTIFTDKVYEMLSKKLPDEVFKLYVSWGIYKKDEEEQFKQDLVADGKDGGKKAKEIFAERFEAREKELKEKGTPDDGFKKLISNKNFRGLSKIWKKVNNIMNLLMNPAASGNVGRSLRTLTRLMANANGFKNYNAYVKHLDTEKEIDELLKTGAQG
ncbi:MAG: hypothetical protein LBH47_00260, partial [Christensenellaceae bacterium]|nr:hypothetical protein [Christensenellaceae bacterium]